MRSFSALNLQSGIAGCCERLKPEALHLSEGEGMKMKWEGSNLKLGAHRAHKRGGTMDRFIPSGRIGLKLLTAALVIGFQVFFAVAAQAHSLSISATARCGDNGSAVIDFTVVSWSSASPDGSHPKIDVSVNNLFIQSGVFSGQTIPPNTFSGTIPAPSGTSATVTATAVGNWDDGLGGGQSASVTIDIPQDCAPPSALGRFTGGGFQIVLTTGTARRGKGALKRVEGGIKITRGFTIHCDRLLSNNLEVNWKGNHFHMLEHTLTTECFDDPVITQKPPKAPVDTIVGTGRGRYNNVDGYTIDFTLVDAGEPGKADKAALKIYETANPANVVLNVPLQAIGGGNVQAHFDQPHK